MLINYLNSAHLYYFIKLLFMVGGKIKKYNKIIINLLINKGLCHLFGSLYYLLGLYETYI